MVRNGVEEERGGVRECERERVSEREKVGEKKNSDGMKESQFETT